MPDLPRQLEHENSDKKDDAVLQKEAEAFLARNPALQLIAQLYGRLRQLGLPWWTPDKLREMWGAAARMRWLAQRPDIRQGITTKLTGLSPNAARKRPPEFQATLIDSAIDDGDTPVSVFEEAFAPVDIVLYGPVSQIWQQIWERFPWADESTVHRDLFAWLLRALLSEQGLEGARKPILSAWDVRRAIDGKVWHTRIPLELRVAVDEARLKQERAKPTEPFPASQDLTIVAPEVICEHIPLKDLMPVIMAAEKAMGFETKTARPADVAPPRSGEKPSEAIPRQPSGAPPALRPRPTASVPPPAATAGPPGSVRSQTPAPSSIRPPPLPPPAPPVPSAPPPPPAPTTEAVAAKPGARRRP